MRCDSYVKSEFRLKDFCLFLLICITVVIYSGSSIKRDKIKGLKIGDGFFTTVSGVNFTKSFPENGKTKINFLVRDYAILPKRVSLRKKEIVIFLGKNNSRRVKKLFHHNYKSRSCDSKVILQSFAMYKPGNVRDSVVL